MEDGVRRPVWSMEFGEQGISAHTRTEYSVKPEKKKAIAVILSIISGGDQSNLDIRIALFDCAKHWTGNSRVTSGEQGLSIHLDTWSK